MSAAVGFSADLEALPPEKLIPAANDRGPTLNPALRSFWLAAANDNDEPIRYRVLRGGRASSKSWDAAGFAIYLACNCKVKFLCARQFQNKIEESVYALLVATIDRFGLRQQFRILDNKIIHRRTGSTFVFYGLWRHINEIKSLEGIDICWLEEAHALTEEQWKILEPTIRKEGSQFWLIFNPILTSDFVWQRFIQTPLPGTLAREINYTENPFLSSTMLRVIDAAREEDYEEFEHIYLGVPREDDDSVVIKRSWIMAAIDAHKALNIEPAGSKRIGFDVADSGADKCATVEAHGPLTTGCDEWKAGEHELLKSTTRVWERAVALGADVIYDSIGVGAGVGAKINELNKRDEYGRTRTTPPVRHSGYNAAGAVWRPDETYARSHPPRSNKDMFANAKAQDWWDVADRFRNTFNAVRNWQSFAPDEMIFIDGGIANLMSLVNELATPRRDEDNAGRVKVESKKDLARSTREGGAVKSPNKADAFIMAHRRSGQIMRISPEAIAAARMPGRRVGARI